MKVLNRLCNLINGTWYYDSLENCKYNPSNEAKICDFPQSDKATVDKAVAAAVEAQNSWRTTSRVKRAEYFDTLCGLMKARQDDFVDAVSLETGKSKNESRAEFIEALHMAQYTFGMGKMPVGTIIPSEIADRDTYVIRKPKGVVAVISPWNFPLAIGGYWCAAPALLEGNTVVWKPSEDSPYIAHLVGELYKDAGFPAGVLNIVFGDGETGEALARHPQVNHICFTGSRVVGNKIQMICAESGIKSFSCETGSKSAVMVFSDADVELALNAAFNSAYKLSGQRCVSSGRILIQRDIFQQFATSFVEMSRQISVGDPFTGDHFYGPLINQSQLDRVAYYNALTDVSGVLLRGERLNQKGYFLTPHVYTTNWSRDKPYLSDEVFGPHIALIMFEDLDDAIRIYNDTDYGLALGVVTSDFKKAREVRERCDFGMAYWNGGSVAAESHVNFGGIKASGIGGASAAGTFDAVVHKVVWSANHGSTLQFPQGLK